MTHLFKKCNLQYLLFLSIWTLLFSCETKTPLNKNYGTIAQNGIVSCAHPLAAEVGISILKKGGNAFDAAIATHFALAVVYPRAGNIGGGGFMVYRDQVGNSGSLDFREKAPAAASEKMYLDANGVPVKDLSLKGLLASGVPGSVDGMIKIHEKYGSLPWDVLLQPAIRLAEDGIILTQLEAEKINQYQKDFNDYNKNAIQLYNKDNWKAGDKINYPNLAVTLKSIKENKRAGFYDGEVADKIINAMQNSNGIITYNDLKNYSSVWRTPIKTTFKNKYTVISMPPPSSGGITLAQILIGLEDFNTNNYKHNSVEWIHLLTELERRAYADRATFLGDNDFYKVPIQQLTSKEYVRSRIKSIDLTSATNSQDIKAGDVLKIESFETTHYSIVDKHGNAVAITTTLNGNFGCKVVIDGAGFFMNNEMDDFSIKPGQPNQFGLTGGEANKIVPNKRMLSSMTPTIVEKDNDLYMVLGTPGGSTIITSVAQTLLNVTEFNMSMQEAVDAKKFHSQWLPDEIYLEEKAFPPSIISGLEKMGHKIAFVPILGKMDCILKNKDGTYEGASDRTRSDGTALGY
ncbi:gamma-glutamyltransferase [Flammeovirga kamogawensis]|uniref:Glutathione hydrolase proenzyme n=1 Tax=Flammeovirga kamogawensis TaxID=373891 RepID=A0ABX8GX90_9BACT|nr:gamma-glutamyltransferase [Flammeovirga kamogawensis]MBB6461167.1 gamma-glutamyltranspeptidase/glutathione hydrolase [Flammeovirga kamogawensis]QWG07732.1 gamma-glutamyltransferase [Flammeovirga kamogawensis]TRX69538.1 gamma-glutamyltransferase [Flammeovirga kamogawensis]